VWTNLFAKLFNRDEDGQVIVLAALGLGVLALMAGLAIDVGYLRYEKQQMQKATDAGALAAATVLLNYGTNTTQSMLTDSARADVTANGFSNASVTAVSPPTSGLFAGNNNYVQVQVQQSFPVFFMHLGGWSTVPVLDTAVGSAVGNASGCLMPQIQTQGIRDFRREIFLMSLTAVSMLMLTPQLLAQLMLRKLGLLELRLAPLLQHQLIFPYL